jgi:uncharacterized coiled-coil DUF342 family protein
MPTNRELEVEVGTLKEQLQSVRQRNSELMDEVAVVKSKVSSLVESLNVRFENIDRRFQGK